MVLVTIWQWIHPPPSPLHSIHPNHSGSKYHCPTVVCLAAFTVSTQLEKSRNLSRRRRSSTASAFTQPWPCRGSWHCVRERERRPLDLLPSQVQFLPHTQTHRHVWRHQPSELITGWHGTQSCHMLHVCVCVCVCDTHRVWSTSCIRIPYHPPPPHYRRRKNRNFLFHVFKLILEDYTSIRVLNKYTFLLKV